MKINNLICLSFLLLSFQAKAAPLPGNQGIQEYHSIMKFVETAERYVIEMLTRGPVEYSHGMEIQSKLTELCFLPQRQNFEGISDSIYEFSKKTELDIPLKTLQRLQSHLKHIIAPAERPQVVAHFANQILIRNLELLYEFGLARVINPEHILSFDTALVRQDSNEFIRTLRKMIHQANKSIVGGFIDTTRNTVHHYVRQPTTDISRTISIFIKYLNELCNLGTPMKPNHHVIGLASGTQMILQEITRIGEMPITALPGSTFGTKIPFEKITEAISALKLKASGKTIPPILSSRLVRHTGNFGLLLMSVPLLNFFINDSSEDLNGEEDIVE